MSWNIVASGEPAECADEISAAITDAFKGQPALQSQSIAAVDAVQELISKLAGDMSEVNVRCHGHIDSHGGQLTLLVNSRPR